MSDTSNFLNSLFGSYEGELSFALDDQIIKSSDPDFISQNDGKLRVYPSDESKVFFLFAAQQDSEEGAWQDCRALPTVSLWRDGLSLFCWAFEPPVAVDDPTVKALMEVFDMQTLEEPIPLPGTDGWKLTHNNIEIDYTPQKLAEFYLEEIPKPEPVVDTRQMYGDAVCVTPYNESDYDGRTITVSIGANQFAREWKPQKLPLAGLIHQFTKHKEGKKDGLAVVLGDMVPGQRVKKAIKTCEAIGLDIDNGTPSAVVDKAIATLDCLAIRATTHSHGKRSSDISKDSILRFKPEAGEIDKELIREYLLEKQRWDKSIVDTVEFIEEDQTDKGIVCRISHKAMDKHRIIVPLNSPYVVANEGRTQQEAMAKWAKVPAALAAKLGLPFDKSCTDLSRLFFLGRHDKGRPYEISLFGGDPLDIKTLQLDNVFELVAAEFAKGGSKSVTAEGKKLGKWWKMYAHGIQIVDIIESYAPDKIRSKASNGYNIECPFDEDHSNAGEHADQACFAINAADGAAEFFHVSCRHQSCSDKTSLDMLGKMIKDEWFEESAITDPDFNVAEIEDAPDAPAAKKLAIEAAALSSWEKAIENLKVNYKPEELDDVCRVIAEANMKSGVFGAACKALAKKSNSTLQAVKEQINDIKKAKKAEAAQAPKDNDAKGRRIFRYNTGVPNFHDAADACIEALRAENVKRNAHTRMPEFYPRWCHMEGIPVEIVTNPKTDHLEFKEFGPDAYWSELCERVVFVKQGDNVEGPQTSVDKELGKHVYHQASKHFPLAPEIIYTPLFAANGTLISKPGYYGGVDYPDINVLLPDSALDVGEFNMDPTVVDVEESVAWLRQEILGDFPFMDYDANGNARREPSEANAFAMLLTPFMRRMIDSVTPIFFITKPLPGTGGTLLGQIPMLLFDGMTSAPARYSNNDEEMNKSIVTEIMQGRMCLFFDDVKEFNSREILRAVTSKNIGGRILGGNRKIERPNNFLWISTGNNPVILSEMDRRIVWIRMNAMTADIQNRVFRHDLYAFILGATVPEAVEGHRAIAVKHLLTLIQYWIKMGMPLFLDRKRTSFEDWSAKVGGVLMLAQIEGFLDNRKEAGQDSDEAAIKAFMRHWLSRYQCRPTLLSKAYIDATNSQLEIIEGINEDQKKHRFYKRLPAIEGRTFVIDGKDYMMCSGHDGDDNVAYYLLDITDPLAPTPQEEVPTD